MTVAVRSGLGGRRVGAFRLDFQGKGNEREFRLPRRISQRYRTDHHETLIDREEMQEFLRLLPGWQDEPIADNVCIPLYFLAKLVKESGTTVVQVGEGADENFLGYWWCEHYRRLDEAVYQPARQRLSWWRRVAAAMTQPRAALSGEALEVEQRARRGEELFWGGAVCWWGERRRRLTPDPTPFHQSIDCPVDAPVPDRHQTLDSHAVVREYLASLGGHLDEPSLLQKIPYIEMKLRLPEHLLMRVDKLTMAHAVEARVPFLDHDVVDFTTRIPSSYKLRDTIGKLVLKKAAAPYLDDDMIYRRKQGFGAPMEEWFREGDFGARCLAAFERSALRTDGFLDAADFTDVLRDQIAGRAGASFQIWTVMNAVLWHASWVEGREDCF